MSTIAIILAAAGTVLTGIMASVAVLLKKVRRCKCCGCECEQFVDGDGSVRRRVTTSTGQI